MSFTTAAEFSSTTEVIRQAASSHESRDSADSGEWTGEVEGNIMAGDASMALAQVQGQMQVDARGVNEREQLILLLLEAQIARGAYAEAAACARRHREALLVDGQQSSRCGPSVAPLELPMELACKEGVCLAYLGELAQASYLQRSWILKIPQMPLKKSPEMLLSTF